MIKSGINLFLLFIPFLFIQNKNIIHKEAPFIDSLHTQLAGYQDILPREKVYLHFDRSFYQPGDDIWFKAYLTNLSNQTDAVSEIMHVELISPRGNVIKKHSLITENGMAKGDFKIKKPMTGGRYKVKAYTRWMKNFNNQYCFEKELQVQRKNFPDILLELDFIKKGYGPGDKVNTSLKVKDQANKSLAKHPVQYRIKIAGKLIKSDKIRTNKEGIAKLTFQLPDDLKTDDGQINFIVKHKGKTASVSKAIPIVLHRIKLNFFPEGGNLVDGVPTQVAFKAVNKHGKPADIKGKIVDQHNNKITEFSGFHNGMGAFAFTPEKNTDYHAIIQKPDGIEKYYDLPKIKSKGYVLNINNKDSTLQADFYSPYNKPVYLISQTGDKIYYDTTIQAQKGMNRLSISSKDFPAGIAKITLFDHNNVPRCERLTYTGYNKNIRVNISTDKQQYMPGEPVKLNIKTSDHKGRPVAANLSLAVVDKKLLSFADDKQDNILSHMLLSAEVKGNIEEPAFYFDKQEPKAPQALEYLLMTQGWRHFTWKEVLNQPEQALQEKMVYQPEKTVIKGRVVKNHDQKPVANARVKVLETEETTYTDSLGRFRFNDINLAGTSKTLKARKGDFERVIQVNNYAQNYIIGNYIRGQVTGKDDKPVPFATIYAKNAGIRKTTDKQGYFEYPTPKDPDTLVFQCVGYKQKTVQLKKQNYLNVNMQPDTQTLRSVAVRSAKMPEPSSTTRQKTISPKNAIKKSNNQPSAPAETGRTKKKEVKIAEIDKEYTNDEIFMYTEKQPAPKSGQQRFSTLLYNRIQYPAAAYKDSIEGTVFLQFHVNNNGKVSNTKVIKGVHPALDSAALHGFRQAVQSAPAWEPGRQRDKPVNVRMTLPVRFRHNGRIKPPQALQFQIANNTGLKVRQSKYYKAREFYSPEYAEDEPARKRSDFRKTIHWEPDLQTGPSGDTSITFYNSDAISSFQVTAEGITQSGKIARGTHTYFTQLPFSISAKIPHTLTYQDEIALPVTLSNNSAKKIQGKLRLHHDQKLKLRESYDSAITIQAGKTKSLHIHYKVRNRQGRSPFSISFEGKNFSDDIRDTIKIIPKGFPVHISRGNIALEEDYHISINNKIDNSLHAGITAYPSVMTDLREGVKSILREPHGCFEQVSSSTYPNIIALQYMETTGNFDYKTKKQAHQLIKKGYKKLTAYETADNGFEWFGNTPPHEGLTAYGLLEFTDMQQVFEGVDENMLQRTKAFLMKKKDGQGGFKQGIGAHGFSGNEENLTNAYIVYALAASGTPAKRLKQEWETAYQQAKASEDAYQLALMANAMAAFNKDKNCEELLGILKQHIIRHGIDSLPAQSSITRSSGKSLQVETAALTCLAFLNDNPDRYYNELNKGIRFLIQSRTGYGGFGSTQATVNALKAITEFDKYNKRSSEPGSLLVYAGNNYAEKKTYKADIKEKIHLSGFGNYLKNGKNKISIAYEDTQQPLPYAINISYNTYTPPDSKKCKVQLSTRLKNTKIDIGQTARMNIKISNKTDKNLPMTLARIGIPTGLDIQHRQLKAMQEKGKFAFYEIKNKHLILYYRSMKPNAEKTINLDLKGNIPGRFKARASSAYLYYTNEHKVWKEGETINITY